MNVVIIGNSAAGLSALQSFRKYDKNSNVVMISKEGIIPYSRVLIPYVLRGKLSYDKMSIRTNDFYKKYNAECVQGEVEKIDSQNKEIILTDGTKYPYDKVLVATGSYAVKPPIPGINEDGIYNMWTKDDTDKLLPCFDKYKKVVVIGSGFVALQAAWAARYRGLDVTVIELMDRIMPSVLDEKGAKILTQKIHDSGVVLHTGTVTEKLEKLEDGTFMVHVKDKPSIPADFIIVGTGVRPNTQFLDGSGVTVDRGIPVDKYMQTNVEDIYAAGDVAAGPTTFGDEHMIHALWPTAVEMGQIAGANMAGKQLEYQGSLNMNVTQMYDVTVASMGKFNNQDIARGYEFDESENGYVKVCYDEKDLLIGGCIVGDSEAVHLLGKMRPLIRKKQKVDCVPEKIEHYMEIETFKDRV